MILLPVPASTLAMNQPLWDMSPATSVQKTTYGIDLLSQGKTLRYSIDVPTDQPKKTPAAKK